VKAFNDAKGRLAEVLEPAERAHLAQTMATSVVAAAGDLPVWIVCDDEAVASWAKSAGAQVLWKPGRGLNGAVNEGVADLAHLDVERIIVAHADLPHAEHLEWLSEFHGVALVPDRHDDGTNVASIPANSGFIFTYGPGSFRRHEAEALRLQLPITLIRDERLGWDVDLPADLATPIWSPT